MNRISLMILMLSLTVPVAAAEREDTPQPGQKFIVGGQDASIEDYPSMVAILDRATFESSTFQGDKFSAQFCAGTLIAPNWVLTSAHCVTGVDPDGFPTQIPIDPRELFAVLNMTDLDANEGDFSDVERIILHQDFDGRITSPTVIADIALLKLATDFPDQPTMPYTTGTGVGVGTAGVSAGTSAKILGWGADEFNNSTDEATTFPTILQEADTTIVSNEDCGDAWAAASTDIDETHICAQEPEVDTCTADSGGPLLVLNELAGGESNFVQVGIASFGLGCADPDFPGVYTRVSEYTEWIEENLRESTLFATFGKGQSGGVLLTSDIVLYNPHATRTTRGKIVFKDPDGNVLEADSILAVGDGSFVIGPLGSSAFSTTGAGRIVDGSVWVSSDEEVSGVIRFRQDGILTGIAGVSPSSPGTRLITSVRREGTVNTGIAILNTTAEKVRVSLELKDESGEVLEPAVKDLKPMARIAEFIDTLFPGTDTKEFRGSVCMETDGGQVAVIAIEQGTGVGEFTTLQVTVVE